MPDWPNAKLRKCPIDQNTKLTKCQIDKMSSWRKDLAPQISKTSDFSRDVSIFQSEIPTVVESILNSCEFLKKISSEVLKTREFDRNGGDLQNEHHLLLIQRH